MEQLIKFKDAIIECLLTDGVRLVLATLVLVLLLKLTNRLMRSVGKRIPPDKMEPTMRDFILKIAGIAVKLLLFVTYVAYLGLPISSIVAAIASCGVAIGLALQGGLSNFAGGVILVFMKPFKDGDFITAAGESGTVMNVGLFYTLLCTVDNRHIYIPNASLTGGSIINASAEKTRRLDLQYGVAYATDPEKLRTVLLDIAAADARILKDPAPVVILSEFADSAIQFSFRVWCASENYWNLRADLQERVKAAFEQEGIQIPYPQMDVHVKQDQK